MSKLRYVYELVRSNGLRDNFAEQLTFAGVVSLVHTRIHRTREGLFFHVVYEGNPSSGGCAKHVVSPSEIRTPIVHSFVDADDQPDICM